MGHLGAAHVVYEVWDHHGMSREVARLKAEMKVLSEHVVELVNKHNYLLEDTTGAMCIVEAGMHDHDEMFQETNRKLSIVEVALNQHNQKIEINNV